MSLKYHDFMRSLQTYPQKKKLPPRVLGRGNNLRKSVAFYANSTSDNVADTRISIRVGIVARRARGSVLWLDLPT